jgi:hypothetical protein
MTTCHPPFSAAKRLVVVRPSEPVRRPLTSRPANGAPGRPRAARLFLCGDPAAVPSVAQALAATGVGRPLLSAYGPVIPAAGALR